MTSVKEPPNEIVVDKSVTQLIIENIEKHKAYIAQVCSFIFLINYININTFI